jgi:hypothetical protein
LIQRLCQVSLPSGPAPAGATRQQPTHSGFSSFTRVVKGLESGLLFSFGSAGMAPEVSWKVRLASRNAVCRQGRSARPSRVHQGLS